MSDTTAELKAVLSEATSEFCELLREVRAERKALLDTILRVGDLRTLQAVVAFFEAQQSDHCESVH